MYQDVLVPTDGSRGSKAAADHAVALAASHGATVHALYVVPEEADAWVRAADGVAGGRAALREHLRERGESATDRVADRASDRGVDCVTAVETGDPHERIVGYAEDVDLVVMGTHGRSGLRRYLLGSVTERVVRQSPVPVLTLRADESAVADAEDAREAARAALEREGHERITFEGDPSRQRSTWVLRAEADGHPVNVHVDADGHARVAHLDDA